MNIIILVVFTIFFVGATTWSLGLFGFLVSSVISAVLIKSYANELKAKR